MLRLKFTQVVPTEKASLVPVAEAGAQGVVADDIPGLDGDSGKVPRPVSAILVAEDILLTDVLGTGGVLSQKIRRKIAFAAIVPEDGEFMADELDVLWSHCFGITGKIPGSGARPSGQ